MSGKRDKPAMPHTFTTVGLWNSGILYLAAPIPILPNNYAVPPNKGVNDFAFLVRTKEQEETN